MPRFPALPLLSVLALFLASCASVPVPGVPGFTRHQLTMKTLTTVDYQQYSLTRTDITFSIALPPDWRVDQSVVFDAQERKIAEFSPGFVEGTADVFALSGPDSDSELISKERLSIGGRRAVRMTRAATVRGGLEGPSRITIDVYYLELPKHVFVMSFQYTTNRPTVATVLRILESVRPSPTN